MVPTIQKHILTEPDRARTPNNLCIINEEVTPGCPQVTATYGNLMSDVELPLRVASAVTAQCDIDTNLPIYDTGGTIVDYEYVAPAKEYAVAGGYWIEKDNAGAYQFTSNCGVRKILRYPTLLEWYQFFVDYYDKLKYSCDGISEIRVFNSYVDLLNDPAYNGFLDIDLDEAQALDDLAKARGGKIFFDWVSQECFPRYKSPTGTTLPTFMTYEQITEELTWFMERQQYFNDWSGITYDDCRKTGDCCGCQEFLDKGGLDTYKWLSSIEPPHASYFCTQTASFTVPIFLSNEIENIGTYNILAREFDVNKSYTGICGEADDLQTNALYKGRNYFVKNEKEGYSYSEEYNERIWGNLDPDNYQSPGGYQEYTGDTDIQWVDGIEIYKDENNISIDNVVITGNTSSKLSDLRDTKVFYDENSNMLPGSLTKDSNGAWVLPVNGTVLDIPYHEGNMANITLLSAETTSRGTRGTYSADYIDEVLFYKKKMDGTRVLETKNLHDLDFVTRYPTGATFSQQEPLQDCVFCDFTYYSGLIFTKSDYGSLMGQYILSYPDEVSLYAAMGNVLRYQETFCLEIECNYPYWLNSRLSIPICYYNMTPEIVDSDDNTTAVATYYLKYRKYDKLNAYNGEIYSPVYFNENYIGISQPENIKANIYIDRGVNSAMQTHLRLGDASCLNDLLQLGNGYYEIQNNN